jgi:hypothetical protein
MFRGSVGGWGGLGGLPPQREGAPNSQVIQTGDEIKKGWQDKLSDIPQTIGYRTTEIVPWEFQMGEGFGSPFFQMTSLGQSRQAAGTPLNEAGGNSYQMMVERTVDNTAPNPEYGRVQGLMSDALSQYGENQTRAQQAYDGMQGQYAENGVLPGGYTQAGFGQISGQDNASQFGADGGTQLGGVSNQFITGAYTPSNSGATYNPNPYSAQNYQPKGWGL